MIYYFKHYYKGQVWVDGYTADSINEAKRKGLENHQESILDKDNSFVIGYLDARNESEAMTDLELDYYAQC